MKTQLLYKLLQHLHGIGFHAVPEFLRVDNESREILSFLKGDVWNYPLPFSIRNEEALLSAADLLRRYHEASQAFLISEFWN